MMYLYIANLVALHECRKNEIKATRYFVAFCYIFAYRCYLTLSKSATIGTFLFRNTCKRALLSSLANMFNRGVGQVQTDLKENGNQPAEFNVNLITAFKVDVKVSQSYTNENGGKNGGKVGGDVPSIVHALLQYDIC